MVEAVGVGIEADGHVVIVHAEQLARRRARAGGRDATDWNRPLSRYHPATRAARPRANQNPTCTPLLFRPVSRVCAEPGNMILWYFPWPYGGRRM